MVSRRQFVIAVLFFNFVVILALLIPRFDSVSAETDLIYVYSAYTAQVIISLVLAFGLSRFASSKLKGTSFPGLADVVFIACVGALLLAGSLLGALAKPSLPNDYRFFYYVDMMGDLLGLQAVIILVVLIIEVAIRAFRWEGLRRDRRRAYYVVTGCVVTCLVAASITTNPGEHWLQRTVSVLLDVQTSLSGLNLRVPIMPEDPIAVVVSVKDDRLSVPEAVAFVRTLASAGPRGIVFVSTWRDVVPDLHDGTLAHAILDAAPGIPVVFESSPFLDWPGDPVVFERAGTIVTVAERLTLARPYAGDEFPLRFTHREGDALNETIRLMLETPKRHDIQSMTGSARTDLIPYRSEVERRWEFHGFPKRYRYSPDDEGRGALGFLHGSWGEGFKLDSSASRVLRGHGAAVREEYRVAWEVHGYSMTPLPEFDDKILIVELSARTFDNYLISPSRGDIWAIILQAVSDEGGVSEAGTPAALMLAVLMGLGLMWVFSVRGPWYGLAIAFLLIVAVFTLTTFAFFAGSVLVNPVPAAVACSSVVLFAFPYEQLRDRRRIFEERVRLSAELQAAHDMQMGLMPKADPVLPGFEIASACVPANEVGGDFYDFVWLDAKKSRLGIAVADVSGKAMQAAMTAVMTSGMMYSETRKSASPREILRNINHPLYLRSDRRVFTAMSFAVIDVRKKSMTFSNAGQTSPIRVRNARSDELPTTGVRLPLGVQEELRYNEARLDLRQGDVLVFYTDGIVEARNGLDDMYGFDRLKSDLERWHDFPAAAIRDELLRTVREFVGTVPQHDDMTVVVVKVKNQVGRGRPR